MALRADEVEMPGGRVATREIIEHGGAVAIVAMDAENVANLQRLAPDGQAAERVRLWVVQRNDEARAFYDLERLWADVPKLPWS